MIQSDLDVSVIRDVKLEHWNLSLRNSAPVSGYFMKIEISIITHIGFVDMSEIKGAFHQDQNGYSTVTLPLLYETS